MDEVIPREVGQGLQKIAENRGESTEQVRDESVRAGRKADLPCGQV